MASIEVLGFSALCTCAAVLLSTWHIYMHLMNYTEPTFQRYIVRIIFMVPVYAMMSFLSLVLNDKSIYFNSIRDIYEAFVIYNFLSLCLAWVGGPGVAVQNLSGRVLKPSIQLMTCCFAPIPLDGRFIRRCKQGCLQFVILKPVLVAVTFILYAKNKYEDGNFSTRQSYLYITIIYTLSYSLALYVLVLFYVACKELLRPFKPVPKFVIIKSVVFLTYWQGVLVFLAAKSGLIKNADDAADVQNFIICIEMAGAAVGHLYAFPFKAYAESKAGTAGGLAGSFTHALNLKDVVYDTVHQFAPTYHDYVLYSEEDARKYRLRTGQEMETMHPHAFTDADTNPIRYESHPVGPLYETSLLDTLPPGQATSPIRKSSSELKTAAVMKATIDAKMAGDKAHSDEINIL
ncbi:transmembrane protein 184A isoform X2 [Selaginella moellendorffii]|nr:transmembrane protein 184A isoform X2 [Selaginella moellendorffii]XP_024519959.1 transmembrane protein 184A isoform X2 [Selaginella moellendorffii]|eukprot:XP_024517367.1 transmembrane protein 184A isoform X2 [Selaginella moellendorffii]